MNEFDKVPPGHRDDDPWTSKEADQAVRVTAKNQRGKLLLSYFKDHYGLSQGLTDEQAAVDAGLTRSCYWKRCGELRDGGWIEPVLDEDGVIKARRGSAGVNRMISRITRKGLLQVREMEG